MVARSVVLCVVVLAVYFPSSWASNAFGPNPPARSDEVSSAGDAGDAALNGGHIPTFEPRISAEMSSKNREQLIVAFGIAFDRVRDVPECRELFAELGADATVTLKRISVYPIGRHEAKPNVCRSSIAYTFVGGGPTWVCRKFWRLSDKQAAMVVIHEALHHAGLSERPRDPSGMTAAAINRMVSKRCGL